MEVCYLLSKLDNAKNTMKTKTLTLADKKVTINKLPLKKLAETINDLSNLPDELKQTVINLDTLSNEEALAKAPMLIATALPHMAGVVAKASNSDDITEDFLLNECGLDDAIELVEAWIELNNIKGILDRVKKMQALYLGNKPKVIAPVPTVNETPKT